MEIFRNKNVRNVVMGVVITVSTVVFAIQFGPGSGSGQNGPSLRELFNEKCAAKVQGSCVDPKTQRAVYRLLTPRDESGGSDVERARQMGLARITLDGLIERDLLVREAGRMGISITDDDVTESIYRGQILVSVPSDNPTLSYYLRVNDGKLYAGFKDPKTKRFDTKTYERTVRTYTGRSPTEFREWQKLELLAGKVRDIVRAPIRVSDAEAFGRYVAEKSNATLEYVEISQDFVKRYASEPTVAEMDAWEKDEAKKKLVDDEVKAKKEAFTPKEKHIRHVLIKITPEASDAEKDKAARTMLDVLARLKAGESFASVAATFSEDGSAEMGGDVGDQTAGFVDSFRVAADALAAGAMTEHPIESQFGWHLIAKDDPNKPLDEAKLHADVRRRLYRQEKIKSTAEELAKQMREALSAKADDAKIKEIADAFTAKAPPVVAQTLIIDRYGAPVPLATAKASAGDAGVTTNDAGASTAADGGIKAGSDAGSATVASVWTPFTVETKAHVAAEDVERPQLRPTGSFNRGGDPIDGVDGDHALKLNEFAFSAKPGDTFQEAVTGEGGAYAVRLKEQMPSTREDFDKNRAEYLPTLLAAKRTEALALYVKRLRESAKSEIQIIPENGLSDKEDKNDKGKDEPEQDSEEPQ